MSETKTVVLMVHETVRECIARDVVTFLTFAAMSGLGVLLQSSAMQWIGGLLWLLWMVTRGASNLRSLGFRGTPQQAADMLAERFGVRAKP